MHVIGVGKSSSLCDSLLCVHTVHHSTRYIFRNSSENSRTGFSVRLLTCVFHWFLLRTVPYRLFMSCSTGSSPNGRYFSLSLILWTIPRQIIVLHRYLFITHWIFSYRAKYTKISSATNKFLISKENANRGVLAFADLRNPGSTTCIGQNVRIL